MRKGVIIFFLATLMQSAVVQAHTDSVGMRITIPHGEKGLNDPLPQGAFDVMVIPLKRVQNLYLIEARADTLTGNFILDTGAPHLVLNKTYFQTGRPSPGTSQYGITGGGNTVLNTTLDSLIINELFYTNIDADIVSLGHLEDARGVRILGLMGASLFNNLEMELDLQHDLVYLYKTDEKGNRLAASTPLNADLEIPLLVENNILFVEGRVANKKLKFCLDTGAERNVLSNTVSNKVLKHFSLTSSGNLAGSGGSGQLVLNGVIDSLLVGEVTFGQMPFLLTNLSYLELVYGTALNGVLGYDFLSQGRTIINVRKKKLYLYFYEPEEDEQ